ncbi:uncharacterized protein LOC143066964 isoform X2 [Mytilus galloprovincialis]|uniref:uncharacterized protein LOC143066964 isoform X2 n=1 Tax=Mytilus galloprovincialis TaxID=29158 RepID=UPI003F7C992A
MKTEVKAMKRKIIFEGGVLPDLYSNMADNKDLDKKKCHSDENITSDGASKVIAVELNKRLPKAKENEQDPIPSDGEDGYPELNLDPAVIEQRKKKRIEKNKKENSSTIEKKQETQ